MKCAFKRGIWGLRRRKQKGVVVLARTARAVVITCAATVELIMPTSIKMDSFLFPTHQTRKASGHKINAEKLKLLFSTQQCPSLPRDVIMNETNIFSINCCLICFCFVCGSCSREDSEWKPLQYWHWQLHFLIDGISACIIIEWKWNIFFFRILLFFQFSVE